MIDLGFVSAILGDRPFDQVVDFAKAHGFSCVEMCCWPVGKAERRYAGVTHIDVDRLDDAAVKAIQAKVADWGGYISGLGYYPNPLDEDEAKRAVFVEHILKVIRASAKLGIGRMNTFIGRVPHRDDDYNFGLFKEIWPAIIREAEALKVRVGIENCAMYFTRDEWPAGKNLAYCPANWRRMFELIPSANFGLNYDPSHPCWMRMDYLKPIREFKDKLFHIHIKDVKVHQERLDEVGILGYPLAYHTPKLPGLGDIDWGAFMSALYDAGYSGPACIEVEDKAFEKTPADVERSILLGQRYMRQFIG